MQLPLLLELELLLQLPDQLLVIEPEPGRIKNLEGAVTDLTAITGAMLIAFDRSTPISIAPVRSAPKTFEIRHKCFTAYLNGLGAPGVSGGGLVGQQDVYTTVECDKN